jgi:TonB family protein
MRRPSVAFFAIVLLAVFCACTVSDAQTPTERKVVSRVAPVYPEIARRSHLGGVVKLEVLVSHDGKVKSAKPVGGSPVFIQSALDAVQKWHFETAAADSIENVQIVFDPNR